MHRRRLHERIRGALHKQRSRAAGPMHWDTLLPATVRRLSAPPGPWHEDHETVDEQLARSVDRSTGRDHEYVDIETVVNLFTPVFFRTAYTRR